MKSSRVWMLVMVSVLMCSLASCGGKDKAADELPMLTLQPSTPAASTPPVVTSTPKPTPTAEPTQAITKYADLTLVFNQPARVDAKALPAVKTYRVFQQTFRKMLGTSTDNPLLKSVAGPTAVTYAQGVLQNQVKDGDKLGGTLTITAKVEYVGRASVLLGGCFNQSKSYVIRPNGTTYVPEVVKKKPTFLVTAIASRGAGTGWQVTDYRLKSGSC